MALERTNIAKSVGTVISINNVPLGGQQGAVLTRHANMLNITNKINGDWERNLAGTKSWNLNCSGLYILDDEAFSALGKAFTENQTVEIKLTIGAQVLAGKALIVDFPLTAIFDKQFKYSIKLLGTGALQEA